MAIKVGTEDKKKVYLASRPRRRHADPAGSFSVAELRTLARTATCAGAGGHRGAPRSYNRRRDPQENTTAPALGHQAAKVGGLASLDPTLHPEIMRQAESLEYTGHGRNIFSQFSAPPEIPKPIASIRQAKVDTGPPPPPPPPPINLGFYGYAAEKTGQKQVFLLHGDDIFIASEGDVVDRRYRVVKIGTASVQVEDIPYHNTQTLPLRQ